MTSKAAQVACAQKVAALKAANAEKAAVPPEFIAASFEHQAKAGLEDQHLSTRTKHNHVPAARGPPAALERLNRAKKAAPKAKKTAGASKSGRTAARRKTG